MVSKHLEVAPLGKGQKVIYEGAEAVVVCGALQKQLFIPEADIYQK